jgi:hypothetical protein
MQKIVNTEIKEIAKDLVHSSEEQIAKVMIYLKLIKNLETHLELS